MLTVLLRVELIILALAAIIFVGYTVTKKKIQLKYSFIWLGISALLIVIAIFPDIVFKLSGMLGVTTPSNFIFLVAITALMAACFSFSFIISKQDDDIRRLIQLVSIADFESESKDEDDKAACLKSSETEE